MWTHKAWQGRFMEHPLPAQERLRAYATWCNAVEGNTTFYATPSRDTVSSWVAQTDPSFRFVIKLPKAITHERRLLGADPELRAFLQVMEPLGERIAAVWIQLPGSFGPGQIGILGSFLQRLPQGFRYAVEVRDAAFFREPRELTALLENAGVEWIPFDTTTFFRRPPSSDAEREAWNNKPRMPLRTVALTDRPIVRFLGRDDPARTVAGWQRWVEIVAAWLREGRSPTVFVHAPDNADAPALARRFHAEVRRRVPELADLPEAERPLTLF